MVVAVNTNTGTQKLFQPSDISVQEKKQKKKKNQSGIVPYKTHLQ
jgi:hypothetical protein